MNTRIYSSTLLWLISAFFFSPATLWADSPGISVSEVSLGSSKEAFKVVTDVEKKFSEAGAQIKKVDLYHFGEIFPAELEAIAKKIIADDNTVVVEKHLFTPAMVNEVLDSEELRRSQTNGVAVAQMLRYTVGGKQSIGETDKKFNGHWDKLKAGYRSFVGTANGASYAFYTAILKQKNAWKEKSIEGAIAVGKAVFMSQVIHHAVMKSAAASQMALNAPAAVGVGLAFGFFFDFFQRENSAFKSQGVSYDFVKGKANHRNPKFFFLWGFFHSILMRESMMVAAHITAAGFTMGTNDFFKVLYTSALGVAGRVPMEMLMDKIRRNMSSPWKAIGVMAGWGIAYSALQAASMFSVTSIGSIYVGHLFDGILLVLGVGGGASTVYLQRAPLLNWMKTIWDRWFNDERRRAQCQTLLIFKGNL